MAMQLFSGGVLQVAIPREVVCLGVAPESRGIAMACRTRGRRPAVYRNDKSTHPQQSFASCHAVYTCES